MYPENTIAQHEQARADAVPPKSSALLVRRFGALVCLAIICIFGAVLLYPHASSVYYLEAGGRALEKAKVFRAAHPHEPNPPLDRALRYFQRATEIDPTDGYAYRRLGQAWLLTGNNEAARDALGRAAELRPNHPLIHIELGYAYDGLGQAGRALAEYEKGGYGPAAEAAIVNYLKVADWQASSGAGDYALEILEKVLVLEPDNLPALYRMMKIYESVSEQAAEELADPLRERLRDLPAEEATPSTEPRLVAYVEQAIAALVQEDIWTQEKAGKVLARR